MIKKLRERSKHALMGLVLLAISVSCGEEDTKERVLPILGDRDVVYKTEGGEEVADTIYHHVPEFSYLNHDSVMVDSKSLKDRIWITDFFFTHCPTICPPMTSQMKRLNENTKELSDHVLFLSFSIDPDRDTPSRLREYRESYSLDDVTNWEMFTGDEEETHLLAKEFFNGAERNDEIEGGFGHTSYFALVDTEGLVRGIYDGTSVEAVDELEEDLRKLLKHEYDIDGGK
jgi:protein SCO1/2